MNGGGGVRGEALRVRAVRLGPRAFRGVARGAAAEGDAGVFAAAALAIFALKAFYARASASELASVLAPTAALVELFSSAQFVLEPGAGYLSRERSYLIAPVCAGLNYTIAAFATLVLGFASRFERGRTRAAGLLGAAAIAYGATLLVNAARISLDLAVRETTLPAWLAPAQAHRLEGVAIYLGSLFPLQPPLSARGFAERTPLWRAALVPLAAYLAATLFVPLINGAYAHPEFWTHARTVLAAALALSAAFLAAAAIRRAAARRGTRRRARRP